MVNQLIKSSPFYYYLSTRYTYSYERIFFLIKYLGFYVVLLWALAVPITGEYIVITAIVLLLFYNLYDFFCYQNDNLDIPEYRKENIISIDGKSFFIGKGIYLVLFNLLLFMFFDWQIWIHTVLLQLCLIVVFWIHNNVGYPFKLGSFISLYFLKIGIFVVGMNAEMLQILPDFLVISVAFNFSYLPKYYVRKSNSSISKRGLLIQPIFWKNLILVLLLPFKLVVLVPLIFTDLVTLIEFLTGKFIGDDKYEFKI